MAYTTNYSTKLATDNEISASYASFTDLVFANLDGVSSCAVRGYFVDAQGRQVPWGNVNSPTDLTANYGFVVDFELTLLANETKSFAYLFDQFVQGIGVTNFDTFAKVKWPDGATGVVLSFSTDVKVGTQRELRLQTSEDSDTSPVSLAFATDFANPDIYPTYTAGRFYCFGNVPLGLALQIQTLRTTVTTVGGGGGGAGTEYTEGDTDATFTGPVVMMEAGSNTATPLKGTSTDGLLVNLGANNDVTVTTVSTVTNVGTVGAVTAITNALPTGTNTLGSVKLTDGTDVADVLDLANSNPLTVAVVDSAGTQVTTFPVSMAGALPTGTNTLGSVKLTDGTDVADVLDLTNANPLTVAIVDGSGTQITSFSGSGIPTVMAKYIAGTCTGAAATQVAFSGGNTAGRKTVRVSNGSATYSLFVRTTKSPTAVPALVEASSATLILAPYASEVFVCDDTMDITVQNSSGVATSTNWTATEEI